MKKLIKYLSTALIFAFLILLLLSTNFKLEKYRLISLAYVYSSSMEPTIMTNDGYILIRTKKCKINDIVTFKPGILKQNYITHRVIDVTEDNKLITKGDNNSTSDQEYGEPPIDSSQILGKALTFNDKPITIPNLGSMITKFDPITKRFNNIIMISICIGVYMIGYIWRNFMKRKKVSKSKELRFKDIAPFLDPVFFLFCIILYINSVIIGFTVKSWRPDEFSYIVTTTKGISSPLPRESFTKTLSIKNATLVPFVVILEPIKQYNKVTPSKLILLHNQNKEYSFTITAPDEIGIHKDIVSRRTYPNLLPKKCFNFLYSKNIYLPLIIIFGPVVIINTIFFIWWTKRWKLGNRKIMGWMIPMRSMIKRLT